MTNSRSTSSDLKTWRRRKCHSCKEIFTTYEAPNLGHIKVSKKKGYLDDYSRPKLLTSIYRACLDANHSEALTSTIENQILLKKADIIKTDEIAKLVSFSLNAFDKRAWARYNSFQE